MWQTCWCWRDWQRACRMAQASVEKLEHTGPAEKKRVASVPQREQLDRAVPQREKKLVLLSFGEERIGGAQTLRNESEEESFREMSTST